VKRKPGAGLRPASSRFVFIGVHSWFRFGMIPDKGNRYIIHEICVSTSEDGVFLRAFFRNTLVCDTDGIFMFFQSNHGLAGLSLRSKHR
jgi:hypothetical protein